MTNSELMVPVFPSANQSDHSDAKRLASASNVSVVLPAGAGKTELIARATYFASESSGPQLILTHTHAGVHALRTRLARLGVTPQSYKLTTIAGWALKWALHFPSVSRLETTQPITQYEWNAVYEGAHRVLTNPHLAASVSESYGGAFIDEYQDCTIQQHMLSLALAQIVSLRVLGDPLQGIFGFTGDAVLWSKDVESSFVQLDVEEHSWRWAESNPKLGTWLLGLRRALLEGCDIDLALAPIEWKQTVSPGAQVLACKDVAYDDASTVVAILKWPNQCHNLAKKLGGTFSSMEELESKDLIKYAQALDRASTGCEAALVLLRIARECMTGLPSTVKTMQTRLEAGRLPSITASTPNVSVVKAVIAIAKAPTPTKVLTTAQEIETVTGAFVHRAELWRLFKRSMAVQYDEGLDTTQEAAVIVRDRTREDGRTPQQRTISRTLLVKGLEYDHSIILNADLLNNAQDFYVAATRGRCSLRVLSKKRFLQFLQPSL